MLSGSTSPQSEEKRAYRANEAADDPWSVAFDTLRADHRSTAISQGRPSPDRSSRRSTKLVEALLMTVE